jgi:hypothetical protein
MTPAPPPPPPSRHLDNDRPLLTSCATSSSHPLPPFSLRHHRPSNVSLPHHRPPNTSSPHHLPAPPLVEGCGHSHTLRRHHQHHEPQQRRWGGISMTARQRRVEKGEQECGELTNLPSISPQPRRLTSTRPPHLSLEDGPKRRKAAFHPTCRLSRLLHGPKSQRGSVCTMRHLVGPISINLSPMLLFMFLVLIMYLHN